MQRASRAVDQPIDSFGIRLAESSRPTFGFAVAFERSNQQPARVRQRCIDARCAANKTKSDRALHQAAPAPIGIVVATIQHAFAQRASIARLHAPQLANDRITRDPLGVVPLSRRRACSRALRPREQSHVRALRRSSTPLRIEQPRSDRDVFVVCVCRTATTARRVWPEADHESPVPPQVSERQATLKRFEVQVAGAIQLESSVEFIHALDRLLDRRQTAFVVARG